MECWKSVNQALIGTYNHASSLASGSLIPQSYLHSKHQPQVACVEFVKKDRE